MTQADAGDTPPVPKLLGSKRTRLRVVMLCVVTLAAGILLAPPASRTAVPASQERAAPLLEEQIQPRATPRSDEAVHEVHERVRQFSAALVHPSAPVMTSNDFSSAGVSSAAQPNGLGVFISADHVLTHVNGLAGRSAVQLVTHDGLTVSADVAAYEPATGLVLLRTAVSRDGQAAVTTRNPTAGTLVVGVGSRQGAESAVPVFITTVGEEVYGLSHTGDAVPPGMPLYTLEGELLAIAGGGTSGQAFPVHGSASRLLARAWAGERLTSIGAAFQELSGDLTPAFGEGGVLITETIEGAPAARAGIQAGDVLVAVGEVAVTSVDAATRVLRSMKPGVPTPLRLRRTRRDINLKVEPAPAYEVAALAHRRSLDAPPGIEARLLLEPTLLDGSSIPPTGRILSINGRAVASRAQGLGQLSGSQPAVMLVRHDGRRFFAVLRPRR